MAVGTRFLPMTFRIFSAIANAPPDFSRNSPMITPITINEPYLSERTAETIVDRFHDQAEWHTGKNSKSDRRKK